MKRLAFILLLLPQVFFAQQQMVIPPNAVFTVGENTIIATNTNFFNRSTKTSFINGRDNTNTSGLALVGSDQVFNTVSELTLPNLIIDGGGVKSTLGIFLVSNQLNLQNGLVSTITFDGENFIGMLPNSGFNEDLDGSSYVVGPLVHVGTGNKLYPIGAVVDGQTQYAPAMLTNIQGDETTATAMQAFRNGGGFAYTNRPNSLDSISHSWFWGIYGTNLDANSATKYSSASVTLPVLMEDEGMVAAGNLKYVILESDTVRDDGSGLIAKVQQNLGGFGSSLQGLTAVDSETPMLNPAANESYVRILTLGTVSTLEPIIHNIITPNGDGNNDYLVIENLAAFGTSEIMMIDRYGVKVFSSKNYESPQADSNEGQDFSFLPPGNYICILKYNDGKNTAKQTISVIKE